MSTKIEVLAKARGVTRLCHFTPSRNLQHIAAGKVGILATKALEAAERRAFNATDLRRFDGKPDYVCCSVEYPNAWYLDQARGNELLFPDWVILFIRPDYLWTTEALFCPRNAAASYGGHLRSGQDGFEALYADRITGTGGMTRMRSPTHLPACPTDQQAEVLIPDRILLSDVLSVAVCSPEQAKTERVRLAINGAHPDLFTFTVAPDLFSKYQLSAGITRGIRPGERTFVPEPASGG